MIINLHVIDCDVLFSRWPDGKYCIYKKGLDCPSGLEEGFVIWDDENKDNKNSKRGELPEGLFNEDTKIFFCCSSSGSSGKEITLPNKSPFLLFAYESILCQKVINIGTSLFNVHYLENSPKKIRALIG